MQNFAADQADFMLASDQTVNVFNPEQVRLYAHLVAEESLETHDAWVKLNQILEFNGHTFDHALPIDKAVAELADGAIDTIYVCLGLLHSLGLDPVAAWKEIHNSNMTKICPTTGKVVKDGSGKVQKPAHYVAPNMRRVVRESWRKDVDTADV